MQDKVIIYIIMICYANLTCTNISPGSCSQTVGHHINISLPMVTYYKTSAKKIAMQTLTITSFQAYDLRTVNQDTIDKLKENKGDPSGHRHLFMPSYNLKEGKVGLEFTFTEKQSHPLMREDVCLCVCETCWQLTNSHCCPMGGNLH